MADLSKFKIVYKERVYRAIKLWDVNFREGQCPVDVDVCSPKILSVMVVDENCRLLILTDEAWMFQFLPL
ncbi:MAG: hypothetical protein IJD78_04330 [Clostridia bacterium]|nr:hypothetical protein [Clostridia bacterium]